MPRVVAHRWLTTAVVALALALSAAGASALGRVESAGPSPASAAATPGAANTNTRTQIPALTAPVIDTLGLLDDATRSRLDQRARELRRSTFGAQLQVLIVASTAGEPIEAYAQRAFDEQKLGRAIFDNGVLMVVAKDDRRVRIQTGSGIRARVSDRLAQRVIDEHMLPRFRDGEFAQGIEGGADALDELIRHGSLPAPSSGKSINVFDLPWPQRIAALTFFVVMLGGSIAVLIRQLTKLGSGDASLNGSDSRWSRNGGNSDGGGASGRW